MKKQPTLPVAQDTPDALIADIHKLPGFSPESRAQDAEPDGRFAYCLFCCTGREQLVASELEKHDVDCMIAYVNRVVVRNGKEIVERRRLLPGYVFLDTPLRLSQGTPFLQTTPDTIKLLSYEYGDYTLHGADLAFYRWLKERRGIIELSQVLKEGDRIRVISGPLKAYEGRIVAVNKKRKCVAISLGEGSLMSKIWCSVEYVERKD